MTNVPREVALRFPVKSAERLVAWVDDFESMSGKTVWASAHRDEARLLRRLRSALKESLNAKPVLKRPKASVAEFQTGKIYDHHVRKERNGTWVLDTFDDAVPLSNEAHMESTEHDSLADAVAYAVEVWGSKP